MVSGATVRRPTSAARGRSPALSGASVSLRNTDEARPRKFYRTSDTGERLAEALTADWHLIDEALRRLTTGDER